MYLRYMKYKDSAIVQNDINYEIYDNTDNLEELLKCKNRISLLSIKNNSIKNLENEEEKYLKIMYLRLKRDMELLELKKLENNSQKQFTDTKTNKYIEDNSFIEDLNNKLRMIDFYLYIRDVIINKKELNIVFKEKENQSKKLKFISLCFENINNPENFINILVKEDNVYSIENQKKLNYAN